MIHATVPAGRYKVCHLWPEDGVIDVPAGTIVIDYIRHRALGTEIVALVPTETPEPRTNP